MAESDMQYKLKVSSLEKSFTLHNRGGVHVQGFSNINFSLQCGQLLALSGPSGVGKSSILKTIYRTYLANNGTILFHRGDGTEVDLASCPRAGSLTCADAR
jgi:alpha-D-ribose 1-methylphosphonate 5-triphosphate synthase subunit PhnL